MAEQIDHIADVGDIIHLFESFHPDLPNAIANAQGDQQFLEDMYTKESFLSLLYQFSSVHVHEDLVPYMLSDERTRKLDNIPGGRFQFLRQADKNYISNAVNALALLNAVVIYRAPMDRQFLENVGGHGGRTLLQQVKNYYVQKIKNAKHFFVTIGNEVAQTDVSYLFSLPIFHVLSILRLVSNLYTAVAVGIAIPENASDIIEDSVETACRILNMEVPDGDEDELPPWFTSSREMLREIIFFIPEDMDIEGMEEAIGRMCNTMTRHAPYDTAQELTGYAQAIREQNDIYFANSVNNTTDKIARTMRRICEYSEKGALLNPATTTLLSKHSQKCVATLRRNVGNNPAHVLAASELHAAPSGEPVNDAMGFSYRPYQHIMAFISFWRVFEGLDIFEDEDTCTNFLREFANNLKWIMSYGSGVNEFGPPSQDDDQAVDNLWSIDLYIYFIYSLFRNGSLVNVPFFESPNYLRSAFHANNHRLFNFED